MLALQYAKDAYCRIDGIQLLKRDVRYGFCHHHSKQEVADYYAYRFISSQFGRYRLSEDDLYRFGRSAMDGQIGQIIWFVERDGFLYWHKGKRC